MRNHFPTSREAVMVQRNAMCSYFDTDQSEAPGYVIVCLESVVLIESTMTDDYTNHSLC